MKRSCSRSGILSACLASHWMYPRMARCSTPFRASSCSCVRSFVKGMSSRSMFTMKNRARPLAPMSGSTSPVMTATLRGGRLAWMFPSLCSRPRSAPSPKARLRFCAVLAMVRFSCWLVVG